MLGLQFAAIALCVNLVVFPLVFFAGLGVALLVLANAYLISREYFEMAATRYVSSAQASTMRKNNSQKIFVAGLIPALLNLIPIVNLIVPLFATSFFVHIFKSVQRSSA